MKSPSSTKMERGGGASLWLDRYLIVIPPKKENREGGVSANSISIYQLPIFLNPFSGQKKSTNSHIPESG